SRWRARPPLANELHEWLPTDGMLASSVAGQLLFFNSEVLVVHRNVMLPLLGHVIFREDRGHRAGGLAGAAVDALLRMNVEHGCLFKCGFILLRVNAVHGTCIHASGVLSSNAGFSNDVS